MRLSKLYTPGLLLPLGLLTLYVPIAHYYVSILELLILGYVFIVIGRALNHPLPHTPTFLIVFFMLYTAGFMGALLNGVLHWDVPAGIWNLNFYYKLLLALGAFWLGAQNTQSLAEIFANRWVKLAVLALTILMLYYPFMDQGLRLQIIGPFWNDPNIDELLRNPRMPGLGINNVIYAMMLACLLILSFQQFLEARISALLPVSLALIVLSLASKLAIGVGFLSCIILFVVKVLPRNAVMTVRNIKMVGVSAILLVILGYVLVYTELGSAIQDAYATVQRFEAILGAGGGEPVGFELRHGYWIEGLRRVELAPFLGIAMDPFNSQLGSLVGFYNPHNEWIRLWMLYGALGLAAWILLLASLVVLNIRRQLRLEWVLLYGSFIAFMLYDGGVDAPRFVPYWFYLIGLNYSLLVKQRSGRFSFHKNRHVVPQVPHQYSFNHATR